MGRFALKWTDPRFAWRVKRNDFDEVLNKFDLSERREKEAHYLHSAPKTLILDLDRDSFSERVGIIRFPIEGLEQYSVVYDLFAVECGLSSKVKSLKDSEWYEVGSKIERVNAESLVTKAANALFYRKRETDEQ